MSQFFKLVNGVVPPGTAIVTVTGDSGGAVGPDAAGNLNLISDDSTIDNPNGITVVGTPGNNTETIFLTNRLQGSGNTVGATTATLFTFALGATPASFFFQINVTGFDGVTPSATGYWFAATARTDGAAATVIGSDETFIEDANLNMSDVDMTATGNSVNLVVTGVAGFTLDWECVGTYVRTI